MRFLTSLSSNIPKTGYLFKFKDQNMIWGHPQGGGWALGSFGRRYLIFPTQFPFLKENANLARRERLGLLAGVLRGILQFLGTSSTRSTSSTGSSSSTRSCTTSTHIIRYPEFWVLVPRILGTGIQNSRSGTQNSGYWTTGTHNSGYKDDNM